MPSREAIQDNARGVIAAICMAIAAYVVVAYATGADIPPAALADALELAAEAAKMFNDATSITASPVA